MPAIWYPGAISQPRDFGGVTMPGLQMVGWHSTETAGWPSYPTFAPQLTADPHRRQVRQHMPVNRSGSTLANAGTYRTNRANVLQVEVIGYCDPARTASPYFVGKWGDEEYRFLAEVAAWAYREWDVPLASTVAWVSYPASYGRRARQRLTVAEFDAYRGHLGHQHAPGNDHGDPGSIDMARLLRFAREIVGDPAPDPDPTPGRPVPQPYAPGQILPGGSITTTFGVPGDWAAGKHTGDDWNVGAPTEDYWFPVHVTKVGEVVYVGDDGWGQAYGRQVHVRYTDGRVGAFCHLAQFSVAVGAYIQPGDQVGRVGYSGRVAPEGKDGSHCHYEERIAPYRYGVDARKPVYTGSFTGPTWTWDGHSYPGAERLVLGSVGPWVTLLGQRLVAHLGPDIYAEGPGPTLTEVDQAAIVALKRKHGWSGGPGVGQATWDLAMSEPVPEEEPVIIRVTSTNIRDDTLPSSRVYPWSRRRAGYIGAVKSTDPDVILVQEATERQMKDLCAGLGPSWTWWRAKDTARDDGPLAIAWDTDLLERTGDGIDLELPSNRRALAVPLRHEKSGETFHAVCSHLDNGSAAAGTRDQQAAKIAGWLPDGPPLVFGADLNDKRRKTGPRGALMAAGVRFIRDLVEVANGEYESHHGGGPLTKDGGWIDDLGVRGMRVRRAGMVRTDKDAPVKAHRNASDHNILWAEIELS